MSNLYNTFAIVRDDDGHQQQQPQHIYDPNLSSVACYSPTHHYNTNVENTSDASVSSVTTVTPASVSSVSVSSAQVTLSSSDTASDHNVDKRLPHHGDIKQTPTTASYHIPSQLHQQTLNFETIHTGDSSQLYPEYHTSDGSPTEAIIDRNEYRARADRLLSGDNHLHVGGVGTTTTTNNTSDEAATAADGCDLASTSHAVEVGNAVDLQLPTVEDAELLYGLYGSGFRYDDYDDVNDNDTVESVLTAGLRNDEDEAAEMLTTLLDHRPSAVAELLGHHDGEQHQVHHHHLQHHPMQMQLHRQPELQHQRSLLEMAMMPLLAAVNDITARDEHLLHSVSHPTVYPGTHPASDYMLMDGQLAAPVTAVPLVSSASSKNAVSSMRAHSAEYVDINNIGFLDDRHLTDAVDVVPMPFGGVPAEQPVNAIDDDGGEFVVDSHVPSRAWASLPTSHLFIVQSPETNEFSVYATRPIVVNTKFGPIEGDLRCLLAAELELMKSDGYRRLPALFVNDNHLVDVSNEYTSNWMRFVRLAHTHAEQNVLLHESHDHRLFFRTCQPIPAQQELKVGYSNSYALRYGLPLLQPIVQDAKPPLDDTAPPSPPLDQPAAAPQPHIELAVDATAKPPALAICDSWPCVECHHNFDTFTQLQQHLAHAHEQPNGSCNNYIDRIAMALLPERRRRQRRRMHRKVVGSGGASVRYECRHCAQMFAKYAALTRHCSQEHKGFVDAENATTTTADDDDDDDDDDDEEEEEEVEEEEEDVYADAATEPILPDADSTSAVALPNIAQLRRTSAQFKCAPCKRYFADDVQLGRHQRLHHSDHVSAQLVQCPQCPRQLLSSSALAMHLRHKHNDSAAVARFQCIYCAQPLHSPAALNEHVRAQHLAATRFACPRSSCAKSFTTYADARKHFNAEHTDDRQPCPDCGQLFKRHRLMQHRRTHEAACRHVCTECGRRFRRHDKMLRHAATRHRVVNDVEKKCQSDRSESVPEVDGMCILNSITKVSVDTDNNRLPETTSIETDIPAVIPEPVSPPRRRNRRKPVSTTKRILVTEATPFIRPLVMPPAPDLGLVELNGLDMIAQADAYLSREAFGILPTLDAAKLTDNNVDEYFEQQSVRDADGQNGDQRDGDDVNAVADEVAAYSAAELFSNYCSTDERSDVGVYYATLVEQIQTQAQATMTTTTTTTNTDSKMSKQTQSTIVRKRSACATATVPTANYERYLYKCAACRLGFKRRGVLVNHMARVHPDVSVASVASLQLPIVGLPQRQYACPYCPKAYGSHSKRRLHIIKEHPGCSLPESLPRRRLEVNALDDDAEDGDYELGVKRSTVNIAVLPHLCDWCPKQYTTRPRLLRHQRQAHALEHEEQLPQRQIVHEMFATW